MGVLKVVNFIFFINKQNYKIIYNKPSDFFPVAFKSIEKL